MDKTFVHILTPCISHKYSCVSTAILYEFVNSIVPPYCQYVTNHSHTIGLLFLVPRTVVCDGGCRVIAYTLTFFNVKCEYVYYVWLNTRFDFMMIREALSAVVKTLPSACLENFSATAVNKFFSGRQPCSSCEVSRKIQGMTPYPSLGCC